MENIYYEKQKGGLCRLHSLNAFFGKHEITVKDFNEYKTEYDVWQKNKYNTEISCNNYDTVNSDQNTHLSLYILGLFLSVFLIKKL